MSIFPAEKREVIEALASFANTNPFSQARLDMEKQALGSDYIESVQAWAFRLDHGDSTPNLKALEALTEKYILEAREVLKKDEIRRNDADLRLYVDLALSHLFNRHRHNFYHYIRRSQEGETFDFYTQFREDYDYFFRFREYSLPDLPNAPHLFAFIYQIVRAFYYIYDFIIGTSPASKQLRVSVWNSIFTHDMKRYRRFLYDRMHDFTTLICGPSGTGKELVARAISLSRYIPFYEKRKTFKGSYTEDFFPLHLSAMAETLIESELFGHKRGSYTGALEDRAGWLEICPEQGTVFLDEIGEVSLSIQVKLLRLLQNRQFQRLGETQLRTFEGKIIAATNRDLPEEINKGSFRADLFYRLCADKITTPSLRDQLSSKEELQNLLIYLSRKIVGVAEADKLAQETYQWINREMPKNYAWPGNVRELEQCLRNVLIRGSYIPQLTTLSPVSKPSALPADEMSADQLLNRYCLQLYETHQNYREVARILDLDWRTVKSRIDKLKSL